MNRADIQEMKRILYSIKKYKKQQNGKYLLGIKGLNWNGLKFSINPEINKIVLTHFPDCFDKINYNKLSSVVDEFISTIQLFDDIEEPFIILGDNEEIKKIIILEICANLKILKRCECS